MAYKRCGLCKKQIIHLEFRNNTIMNQFLTPWGKIKSTRETKFCAKHQRNLSQAVKRARFLALLPYVSR